MRKSILFFILFCSYVLHGSSTFVDERKSDLYFANGILTNEDEAMSHAARLYRVVRIEIYAGSELSYLKRHNNEQAKVYVAYNYSFKKDFGDVAGGILDIMESYEQLTNTSTGVMFST